MFLPGNQSKALVRFDDEQVPRSHSLYTPRTDSISKNTIKEHKDRKNRIDCQIVL